MRTDANTCPVRLYEKVRFDPLYRSEYKRAL